MVRKNKPISRTALLQSIQRAYAIALQASRKKIPTKELFEQSQFKAGRREFLNTTGRATLLTALAGTRFLSSCTSGQQPVVTIVGAGISGLNAAYTLRKAGIFAQIYEASPRTGGRIFTGKDILGNGLTTELGGEFIDSSHADLFSLAQHFELPLLDTQIESEKKLIHTCYYFDGRIISDLDIIEMLSPFVAALQKDIDSLSDEISYKNYSEQDLKFDRLSIAAYLTALGISGTLYKLLDVAYTTEYGLNIDEQSAINLLILIAPELKGEFNYSGFSDERYKIEGGNQRIPDALARLMQDQIHIDHTLESVINKNNGKKTVLNFIQTNGSSIEIESDFVIITMPFTILKDINLDCGLSPVKIKAINEMGYGKNAKLFMGFNSAVWREMGYSGFAFSDNGLQNGWDNSQLQKAETAGYTIFTGGTSSDELIKGTDKDQAEIYLPRLGSFFPDALKSYNQKSARFHWPSYAFAKASYTCYHPGQYTSIEGAQREPAGNIYFAGEHCSYEFQGFMNGAAQTGRFAAEAILEKLR